MSHPFDPWALFERSARLWPDRIALRIGDREWSYSALLDRALAFSNWCEGNSEHGERIAVFAAKHFDTYAAILGILRAGRSYVPLHPDHPLARWQNMIDRAEIKCGFVCKVERERVAAIANVEWNSDPAIAEGTDTGSIESEEAYVMFTSGSTGEPKGVPVGRRQVAHYLEHILSTYTFTSKDRFTQLFALTFDLSVHDLFVAWGAGGTLCVPSAETPLNAASFVRDNSITVWFSVPSQVRLMRRMRALSPVSLPSLTHSFFCGEALSSDLAIDWMKAAPHSRVIDLYGPTETTIAVTSYEVNTADADRFDPVPLGRPFPGHEALIENDGVLRSEGEGELLIAGPQVNRGYLNDPIATAKSFIDHADRKWYCTGDLVRRDAAGVLHFLGRNDEQVKVMGHRVETAEVDAVLHDHLRGGNAITVPMVNDGVTRLITFIDVRSDIDALFQVLRDRLPPYMIPERIVHVDGFPYNASGKLDRKALIASIGAG